MKRPKGYEDNFIRSYYQSLTCWFKWSYYRSQGDTKDQDSNVHIAVTNGNHDQNVGLKMGVQCLFVAQNATQEIGDNMKKKQLTIYAILAIALIIAAYFIASKIPPASNPSSNQTENDWVGISLHSLSANEAQLVNESGARWIRIDASPDFGTAVTNAKAYNLKVLGILDSWMFNQTTTFTLEEWRNAVTHYVSNYSNVDAWEIWNEPANPTYPLLNLNITAQENMSRIVEFYYSIVQTASPIIRQYDPTAKIVLFGGLNLYSGSDPNLALDKEFARQLAAMNIEQYGDAISIHAYPWMNQVQPLVWNSYTQSLAYYRALFTSNKTLEIWVTETGQPIEASGEQGQAQYMTDALGFFQGKVTHLFWYSLIDNAADQKSFGLIGNATTPRPAYYALQKQLTGKPD
ncbi:MAG: hypothetical protein ABSB71_13420 [Candidatus Bathyarchaeia archaeon]|jgi:hypothetical protein